VGVDFLEELSNLHPGPWEVLLPEAQAPKGTHIPLRGTLGTSRGPEPRYLTSKFRSD
jgi:hypothetical protein